MRHFLLLCLLPCLALADVTVNGTVNAYILDGGVQLQDKYGEQLSFVEDRMDVGRDVPLFADRFVGASIAAHRQAGYYLWAVL